MYINYMFIPTWPLILYTPLHLHYPTSYFFFNFWSILDQKMVDKWVCTNCHGSRLLCEIPISCVLWRVQPVHTVPPFNGSDSAKGQAVHNALQIIGPNIPTLIKTRLSLILLNKCMKTRNAMSKTQNIVLATFHIIVTNIHKVFHMV